MGAIESDRHSVNSPFSSRETRSELTWDLGGGSSRLILHADGSRTGRAVAVAEHLWPAGSTGGLHSHRLEDEGFYVIEGELEVSFPDLHKSFKAGPGQFLWQPRLTRHNYRVSDRGPVRVLQFVVPGTDLMPGFFADVAAGRAIETSDQWGPADYGIDFSETSRPTTLNQQLLEPGAFAGATPLQSRADSAREKRDLVTFQQVSNRPFASDPTESEVMQVGRGMMTDVGMVFHAFGFQTGNTFGLIEINWGPGDVAGPHVHHLEDEGFYVLDGELTLHVMGAGTIPARAGDFVWAPRGIPHYYAVTGERGARVLVFEVPGGTLIDFFYRSATEGRGENIESDEGLQEFVEWSSRNFGIDFFDPALFE